PDRYGSPYKSPSAFAAWPGLLAEPRARVSAGEESSFRERHAAWIGDWERFAGRGAVADQVRFEREWAALRGHAADRGVRLIGDVPIYVAPRGADHRAHPELFLDDVLAAVTALRRSLGLPGMVVLQWAFDAEDPRGPHRLENHEEHSVAYTGTHDTDTLCGWWASLAAQERAVAQAVMPSDRDPHWALIRLLFSSRAEVAMTQLQDVLGLGSEARMNVPGRARGSWRWRLRRGQMRAAHAARLREAAEEAGRLGR